MVLATAAIPLPLIARGIAIMRANLSRADPAQAARARSAEPGSLDLDLRSEFHHLLRGHAEERCRAFGVSLQERKQRFSPHPHAGNVLARDDGLAADIIGDVGQVDTRQLSLF